MFEISFFLVCWEWLFRYLEAHLHRGELVEEENFLCTLDYLVKLCSWLVLRFRFCWLNVRAIDNAVEAWGFWGCRHLTAFCFSDRLMFQSSYIWLLSPFSSCFIDLVFIKVLSVRFLLFGFITNHPIGDSRNIDLTLQISKVSAKCVSTRKTPELFDWLKKMCFFVKDLILYYRFSSTCRDVSLSVRVSNSITLE